MRTLLSIDRTRTHAHCGLDHSPTVSNSKNQICSDDIGAEIFTPSRAYSVCDSPVIRRDSTQGQIFNMSMIRSVGPPETTKAFHSADFPDGPLNLSVVLISPSLVRSSNSTPPTTVPILRLSRRRSQQVPWPDRLFLFRFRPHRST